MTKAGVFILICLSLILGGILIDLGIMATGFAFVFIAVFGFIFYPLILDFLDIR